MTFEGDSFGTRMRALRERRGLTRDELARLVGATGNAVYHWEIGRTHPHHDMYERVADALQASIDYLMRGER